MVLLSSAATAELRGAERRGELQWAREGLPHGQGALGSVEKDPGAVGSVLQSPHCSPVTAHTSVHFHAHRFPFCSAPFLESLARPWQLKYS